MRACIRRSIVISGAGAMLFALSVDGMARGVVIVRTYDHLGMGQEEMALARQVASTILGQADLLLAWHDCHAGCGDPPGSRDIILRITATPPSAPPGTMGFSVVDLQSRSGKLATVYADRIRAAALRTGVKAGALLGRAIAHEIVHLRLGSGRHAAAGLMRARWSDHELRREHAADWALTPDVVAQLGGAD